MQQIVADLLASTNALGVWLMKGETVLAGAVQDPSITPPRLYVHGETWVEIGDTQLFAEPMGGATLVLIFNNKSSLGLVRLRVRHSKDAIKRELATPRS